MRTPGVAVRTGVAEFLRKCGKSFVRKLFPFCEPLFHKVVQSAFPACLQIIKGKIDTAFGQFCVFQSVDDRGGGIREQGKNLCVFGIMELIPVDA